jgi:lipopolysaccharide/colanic/teichoic acid biosynthesis glycosyltransferase
VADELPLYRAVPHGEAAYLAVKPGLTGLWQVSGRNDTTYEERVRLDVEYVRNRCLLGDLRILLRTPGAALMGV